jgi:hypothetical protein
MRVEAARTKKEARMLKVVKRVVEVLGWLTALGILAFAGRSVFAAGQSQGQQQQQPQQQNITITVKPSQTVEERVADEAKEKQLRKAAEEKLAAEESAKAAEAGPRELLARARTVYVESGTSYFEPVQLQNALLKRDEVEGRQWAMLDGYQKRGVADIVIEVDRPLFTFTFTYKITSRGGVVLSTGKVTAFDGNDAAPKLAERIVKEVKKARGESEEKKKD